MRKRTNAVTKLRLDRVVRSTRGKKNRRDESGPAQRSARANASVSTTTARKLPRRRLCSAKSEIRQNRLRNKRRVYLNTPMFYCTEINIRTAQLAHQTDERRRSDRQKRRLYLSHATRRTLVPCQTTRKKHEN